MSYDIILLRGRLEDWPDYQSWQSHDLDRLDALEASGSPDWPFYQPTKAEVQKLEDFLAALDAETDEQVGLDLGYESADIIGVNLAYWPETLPHLRTVVSHLNGFANGLDGTWIWADPQDETLSEELSFDAVFDVFRDLTTETPPPRRTLRDWVKEIAIFTLTVAATIAIISYLDPMQPAPCAPFEIPGDTPGTCSVPCLEDETERACAERAQKLWEDAGIEAVPVE